LGVRRKVEDNVGVIVLERPEKLNALTLSMWTELAEALNAYCSRGLPVVITGSGRAFSAGDDIGEMYRLSTPSEASRFFSALEAAVKAMVRCRSPVVAAVNGIAVGGGAEMLLLADYVVASKDAWLSFPEARLGLIPPILLSVGLGQLGPRLVRSLALTGRRLSAEEARQLGIVDEVVDGNPLQRAKEVALDLATIPQPALSLIKASTAAYTSSLLTLLRSLESLVLAENSKERMRMFLEKKLKTVKQ